MSLPKNSSQDNPLQDILIGKMSKAWADNSQIPVTYQPQTQSTNALAKDSDLGENDFKLTLTDFQSEGRGRQKNKWQSEKGGSLLSTWSFYLPQTPHPSFTSRVGMALWRALKTTWTFIPFSLKAPNDIYVLDKKISGILIETISQGSEIITHIGIGINVLNFPENIPMASSLVHSFPKNLPLLGTDWIRFLDRLFFELTEGVSAAGEPLNSTDCENLKWALNQWSLLKAPYDEVLENAELISDGKKVPWSQI